MQPYQNDTIAAISTPVSEAGIGIVRLSGHEALSIADRIFFAKNNIKPSQFKNFSVRYGLIRNIFSEDNEILDEALINIMRAPKTYTREDIVEINCHSGIVPLRKILELVLRAGARLAEPGEFTKRAFLNGRIDLAQAEAVLGIVKAKTDLSLRASLGQLRGSISKEINKIKDRIIEVKAILEAIIDFPEEDIDAALSEQHVKILKEAQKTLKSLVSSSEKGIILKEGLLAVICGKPNVGKSSLLNAVLKKERAIVTPIPGTTRDTIEELVNIEGLPLRIVDTAGISEDGDIVVKEGVRRASEYIGTADLVLFVIDNSGNISEEDIAIYRKIEGKDFILVLNKIDLTPAVSRRDLENKFTRALKISPVSALSGEGIQLLEEAIRDLVLKGDVVPSGSDIVVTEARHKNHLINALSFLENALKGISCSRSAELIAYEINSALKELAMITGEHYTDDVLENIFSRFCIGK